jgi:hypothetical protein
MQSAAYYLGQAEKAERLASMLTDERASAALLQMAEDYRDIAEDLTNGAIDIRHPERMPQSKPQQGRGPGA